MKLQVQSSPSKEIRDSVKSAIDIFYPGVVNRVVNPQYVKYFKGNISVFIDVFV